MNGQRTNSFALYEETSLFSSFYTFKVYDNIFPENKENGIIQHQRK